jgi:hypothetical protein
MLWTFLIFLLNPIESGGKDQSHGGFVDVWPGRSVARDLLDDLQAIQRGQVCQDKAERLASLCFLLGIEVGRQGLLHGFPDGLHRQKVQGVQEGTSHIFTMTGCPQGHGTKGQTAFSPVYPPVLLIVIRVFFTAFGR